MTMPLKQIEAEALQLAPEDLDALIVSLIAHRDADPLDTPEAIARAWDEEIGRRLDAMDRGEVQWIDEDEALARLRTALTGPR